MASKIPILKIENILISSIQVELEDETMMEFQTQLLEKVSSESTIRGVVIDITPLDLLDSFMVRTFNDLAKAVHIMGVPIVLCGTKPEVAITMVEMGLDLPNIYMALNLDQGIKKIREHSQNERQKKT